VGGPFELVRRSAVIAAVAGCAVITPAIVGSAGTSDYALTYSSGKVVRWNPCQTISYKVNPDRAPKRALSEVKYAVERVAARTGITFVYDGRTSTVPQSNFDDHADRSKRRIIFAWARPGSGSGRSTLLPSGAAGEGGWAAQSWTKDGRSHDLRIIGGFAIFNAATFRDLRSGFGRGETSGQLILHELGHAMGLEHVGTKSQIMYPRLMTRDDTAYAAGDRTGLSKVGRAAGCIH
jgi:hypothetical protein